MPQIDLSTFLPIISGTFIFLICSFTFWQIILFPWISSWNKEETFFKNFLIEKSWWHHEEIFYLFAKHPIF